jgi:putative DNA primase/helicase
MTPPLAAPDFLIETDNPDDIRPPAFSDEALALQFAERHANDLRYVAAWGRWLHWDQTCWQFDDTLRAFDRARRICREAAAKCDKPKIATMLASAKTVAAVERLAKADRWLAATVDQWDADPWLLNTPTGVVDLQTGKSRQHRHHDHMTKLTGVAPDASCPIATWLEFLNRIMGGNSDLVAFVQRLAGYALTGLTREHALFFLFGTGANGKTTFVNAITSCLGDYHRTAPIETFTDSKNERHPTDLASLRGARLVTAVETEEGRRWAESKIKALTGGDKIAARFMRQDFFEYAPQFKLVIAGNHKPGLRSVDEAIRRRFNLVPFTITIPLGERDEKLSDKFRNELPGILAWMIQGCLEWQTKGLAAPEEVKSATAAYLEAEERPTNARLAAKRAPTNRHIDLKRAASYEGITPEQFVRLARIAYGKSWQGPVAADMGVSVRGVIRWAKGEHKISHVREMLILTVCLRRVRAAHALVRAMYRRAVAAERARQVLASMPRHRPLTLP